MKRDPDPFAMPPERTAIRDDPFARAALAGEAGAPREPTDTLLGPLAQRDPDAPAETTGVLVEEPASLEDVIRRARWGGFLAGAVVGALVAAGVAFGVSWWTAPPPGALPPPSADARGPARAAP